MHFAALVYATFVLRHSRQLGPWTLHPPAQRFAWWTYVGYVGSCVFHLVPYATLRSYQLALCFDFMCITCAHTALCICSRALFDLISAPPSSPTGWPLQARLRHSSAGSTQPLSSPLSAAWLFSASAAPASPPAP